MIYSLLVLSSPVSGLCNLTAAQFAHSLLSGGHQIHRVFFLDAGTYTGNANAIFPQDDTNPLPAWVRLAEDHQVELVLCVSSALRRGLHDKTEARRHDLTAPTIHPAFIISGLGQLIDASAGSDRLVTFGG